jgi:hypothetical protein
MDYWVSEAAEWKKLRDSSDPYSIAVQLDWCAESKSH